MAEKKFLDLVGLQKYDEKIKARMDSADAQALSDAKAYADGLADNYDAAGTAATKVQELADGAVSANTAGVAANKEAIAKLNGTATQEGSVAKAIADAKATIDADVDAVEAKADGNAANITTLQGKMTAVEKKAGDNETNISALTARMDAAEADIDAMEEDIGNVDELSTTAKTLQGAINEVYAAVGAGGTAATISLSSKGATDAYANVYELSQGGSVIGTINIPKDMVVESGTVETNPDGMPAGTYIKLVLANVETPLFINVGTLVDIYVAKADAAQVQVAIDTATREISATIVAGSIGADELAANAVVTAKIADKNVTKAKLSTEVQASLDKADVAETNANAHADGLNSAMDARMKAVESQLGTGEGSVDAQIATAKQEAITAASEDATAKSNQALTDAKAYTDAEAAKNKALIDANTTSINGLDTRVSANETDISALKASIGTNGDTTKAIADAKKAGTDAQAAVNTLAGRVTVNEESISTHGDRLTALETKVGDGFKEITTAEIEALFTA